MSQLVLERQPVENRELALSLDVRTQFSELIDGAMRTDFKLFLNGGDLIGEDGRSMDETTQNGILAASEIVERNPDLACEPRRRDYERDEFCELVDFADGIGPNTKIAVSDFPPELWSAVSDVGGYNVTRKQTMLRIYTRGDAGGSITMTSKSLDRSDRGALEAIYRSLGQNPQPGELLPQRINVDLTEEQQKALADDLTTVYDTSLAEQYGGQWYAGRQPLDYRNTFEFVCRQQDIIAECIRLDTEGLLNSRIMYDFAATMNARFAGEKVSGVSMFRDADLTLVDQLYREANGNGDLARSLGKSFSACGDTLAADDILNVFNEAGFGNKTTEKEENDEYGPLTFKCTRGHRNRRPRHKLISCCRTCGTSVEC